MLYSIDRIEETVAVLVDDDGNDRLVPVAALPPLCRPGIMVREMDGVFAVDEQATAQRRQDVVKLQQSICNRRRR